MSYKLALIQLTEAVP